MSYVDVRDLEPGTLLEADICIVGAGAAGITLACELDAVGKSVILLEAGGRRLDAAEQAVFRGETVASSLHAEPHLYRRRMLGGSTSIWGGRCVPLDPIDFEARSHVPNSGWPFAFSDLAPHYHRANTYCEVGQYAYDVKAALGVQLSRVVEGFDSDKLILDAVERFSKPTDFGKAYGKQMAASRSVRVLLQSPCRQIDVDEATGSVTRIRAGRENSREFYVKAHRYVLAAGGLETVRLLMVSDETRRGGFGNAHDRLGRFYMCHLENTLGELHLAPARRQIVLDFERSVDGVYVRRKVCVSRETQQARGLLNTAFRLHYPLIADPSHGDPILSAMYIVKDLIIPEYRRKIANIERLKIDELGKKGTLHLMHAKNILANMPKVARFGGMWLRRRTLAERKLPFVVRESVGGVYPLDFNSEQEPNFDSRVMLSDKVGADGMRQLKVDWRPSRLDHESLAKTFEMIQGEFAKSAVGVLEPPEEGLRAAVRASTPIGGHHIGTARMSGTPSLGVVDADCRVHGTRNLYVSSSACFPTSGHANPTLTIVALAIRLADHLKQIPA